MREPTSPNDAVRAELRATLFDLADALLNVATGRNVLLNGIRHAWILTDIAGVGEGVLRTLLRNLNRDLTLRPAEVDRSYFANQLTAAADRV